MKIFLASGEQYEHSALLIGVKAPRVLMSYYHGAHEGVTYRRNVFSILSHAKERLCDSGAFTLRNSAVAFLGYKRTDRAEGVDYDKYLHDYIRWLKRVTRMGLLDWWVEMDVGAVVGEDWVRKQRELFLREGLGRGLINVWHQEHDWDHWLYLLREAKRAGRSNYVAIEGHQMTRPPLRYGHFLREAYRRGVRVHGFKMTKADDLRKWPFYSVDSTTWVSTMYASRPATVRIGGMASSVKKTDAFRSRRANWRGPIPRRQTQYFRRDILLATVQGWLRAERQLDDLWKLKGVDWEAAIANPELVEDAA